MRLSRDPLIAESRPLWVYAITTLILPRVAHERCRSLGFSKFISGSLEYWHRPAMPCRHRPGSAKQLQPIVFCHGLGVGVLPYLKLVEEICDSVNAEIFLLDMPHLASRPKTDVPSPREAVACIIDMLSAWGHSHAHFIGHSFGTVVITWVLRRSEAATSVVLLDPVCFLLMKHDVLANVVYSSFFQPLTDFRAAAFEFFIFHELYVAHALTRNFFWQENDLAPSKVNVPAVVLLSGEDTIVPAHSVRRLIECEKRKRQNVHLAESIALEGGSLVCQDDILFSRQNTEDKSEICSNSDLSRQFSPEDTKAAHTPLELIWRANAGHSDCWEKTEDRHAVVQALLKISADAEGCK